MGAGLSSAPSAAPRTRARTPALHSPQPPRPGVTSVALLNTGPRPLVYLATTIWVAGHYVPGVLTGDGNGNELAGVIDAGDKVDITSAFIGGYTALLGSSLPFSDQAVSDEGTIVWPHGVQGSNGASV